VRRATLTQCAAPASRLRCSYGLTETSRLGCQVKLTPQMNGMQVLQRAACAPAACTPCHSLLTHTLSASCPRPRATSMSTATSQSLTRAAHAYLPW
jgi:hypothetical protein